MPGPIALAAHWQQVQVQQDCYLSSTVPPSFRFSPVIRASPSVSSPTRPTMSGLPAGQHRLCEAQSMPGLHSLCFGSALCWRALRMLVVVRGVAQHRTRRAWAYGLLLLCQTCMAALTQLECAKWAQLDMC